MMRRARTWIGCAVPAALLLAACGGANDDADGGDSEATVADAGSVTVASDSGDDTDDTNDTEDTANSGDGAAEATSTTVDAESRSAVRGGEVILAMEAEATGFRPWDDATCTPCANIEMAIFDRLTEIRADGTIGPWLATSFTPNEDFTEWTFDLRDDVVFHNGVPFNAQTLVDMYAIQQEGAVSAGAFATAGLTGVEATGEHQVKYTLSRPNSAFPSAFAGAGLYVFEPGAAAELGAEFSNSPVGTGPFTMVSRDRDNETIVERNPDYWKTDDDGNRLPHLDRVVFRPVPDEGTRLDAVLSGTVNAMQTLRQGTLRDAREASADGFTMWESIGNQVGAMMFNAAVPPYDDVRVRRGLAQIADQNLMNEALGGADISPNGTQFFNPDSPWYSQAVADAYPSFDFDAGVAELQSYVDDPGRSDGKSVGEPISVEVSVPPDPSLVSWQQVIEQLFTLTEMVDVTLTNFDQATHVSRALGAPPDFIGDFGIVGWRLSGDTDPAALINPLVLPYNAENAVDNGLPETLFTVQNLANLFDPEVLQWAIDAAATDDFDERYARYEQIMLRWADVMPWHYTSHTPSAVMTGDNIMGLADWTLPDGTVGRGHPSAQVKWGEVWIEE